MYDVAEAWARFKEQDPLISQQSGLIMFCEGNYRFNSLNFKIREILKNVQRYVGIWLKIIYLSWVEIIYLSKA